MVRGQYSKYENRIKKIGAFINSVYGKVIIFATVLCVLVAASGIIVYHATKKDSLIIQVNPGSFYIGENIDIDRITYTVQGLDKKHDIQNVEYDIYQQEENIHVSIKQFDVVNKQGENVKDDYIISCFSATYTWTKRHIEIITPSVTEEYSGNQVSANYYDVKGELAPDHEITVVMDNGFTECGDYDNSVESFTITDNNGENVTDNYIVSTKYGVIRIKPVRIIFTSGSKQKVFDGKPLVCKEAEYDQGKLFEGHSCEITYYGTQTLVGSSYNDFTVLILNEAGNLVTHNYDMVLIPGTLTVLPNETDNPDPTPSPTMRPTPSPTPAPTQQATPEPTINNENDYANEIVVRFPPIPEDNKLYSVTFSDETVTQSEIYGDLYLKRLSFGDYTGTGWGVAPIYKTEECFGDAYLNRSDIMEKYDRREITITRAPGAYTVTPYYVFEYPFFNMQNDVFSDTSLQKYTYGVYTNVKLQHVIENNNGEITDKEYIEHIYSNYLSLPQSTKNDLLRIGNKKGINANSPTLVFDIQQYIKNAGVYNLHGKEYPENVDVAVYFLEIAREGICQHFATAATAMYRAYGIPARYTVGYYSNVNFYETNTITEKNGHAWVEIFIDSVGWVPIEVTGNLQQLPPEDDGKEELHIKNLTFTKEYDGIPLELWEQGYAITSGKLKPGHEIECEVFVGKTSENNPNFSEKVTGPLVEPGKYTIHIFDLKIVDANGNDVSDMYSTYIESGEVIIYKRTLKVITGSISKVYDGIPAYCDEWYISHNTLLPGHVMEVTLDARNMGWGVVNNEPSSWRITDVNGRDVSRYYDVHFLYGKLEVS